MPKRAKMREKKFKQEIQLVVHLESSQHARCLFHCTYKSLELA